MFCSMHILGCYCRSDYVRYLVRDLMYATISVPARLGKGQGAKEIGHILAREQPKFGQNLVRKRHQIGHTFTRARPKFGLVGD